MLKSQPWAVTRPRSLQLTRSSYHYEQKPDNYGALAARRLVHRSLKSVKGPDSHYTSTRALHSAPNPARVEQFGPSPTASLSSLDHVPLDAHGQRLPSSQSQIRQSLRAWSAHNERVKSDSVPDSLSFEGKVTQLPNALFVGEREKNTKGGESLDEDSHQDMFDDSYVGDPMTPGTLTAHSSLKHGRQLMIYLGDIGTQSLILLEKGIWAAEKLKEKRTGYSKLRFVTVPNFLSQDEVDRLVAYMPRQDVRRSAGEGMPSACIEVTGHLPDHVVTPVLAKISAFDAEVKSFARDHKHQLERIHDVLAEQRTWRRIRLAEIPPLALGMEFDDMSDAAKMCFISYTTSSHPLVVPFSAAGTLQYLIGPKELNETIDTVNNWARLYQEAAAQAAVGRDVAHLLHENPLSSFIDKARRIILRGRKTRPPTNLGFSGPLVGPTVERHRDEEPHKMGTGEALTDDDTKIVAYLWDAAVRRPVSVMGLAQSALIVRAIGAYSDTILSRHAIRAFLHELGCLNPWDRIFDLTRPNLEGVASQHLSDLLVEVKQSVEPDPSSDAAFLPDSMAALRKDWADLEAFSIDSFGTTHAEDAFSIEPASEIEGGHWFHTHIAHPTAHFSPDHPIARFARARGVSDFVRDGVTPPQAMLPLRVLREFKFKRGVPVLTVSTLLDADCSISNVKIEPAYLNNIISLDLEAVQRALGRPTPEQAVLVVGKVPESLVATSEGRVNEVPDVHLHKLFLVQKLLAARLARREQEVETPAAVNIVKRERLAVALLPEAFEYDRQTESYHWRGDPGFGVRGPRQVDVKQQFQNHYTDSLVAQATRLTTESMGKWLQDRNIPAVFQGQNAPPGFSMETLNKLGVYGSALAPTSTRTSSARPLLLHNIKHSASCTSPLRRFIDMMNLFQVDSYLRAEAQGVLQPDAPVTDDSIMAYSRADVDEYLLEDSSLMDLQRQTSQLREQTWLFQALFRAFHFKEAQLPEIVEMLVESPGQRDSGGQYLDPTGFMVPWFPQARAVPSPEGFERAARPNQLLPVKILRVDPLVPEVVVQAIGPATDTQQILGPVSCYTQDNFVKQSASTALGLESKAGSVRETIEHGGG